MKKTTIYIFLMLSFLLLADSLMYYYYQMSFAGYYSDIILFWLWFFISILIIVLYWKKTMAKLFLTAMLLALIGSILLMMIPFYTFILSMTSFGLRIDKNLNEKYRVQVVGYSVMTHPWLELIKKRGILEQRVIKCTEMDIQNYNTDIINVKYEAQLRPDLKISEVKDIFFETETDSTIALTLFYGGPNKILTFNKLTNRLMLIKKEY
jgi:hypothetical protein